MCHWWKGPSFWGVSKLNRGANFGDPTNFLIFLFCSLFIACDGEEPEIGRKAFQREYLRLHLSVRTCRPSIARRFSSDMKISPRLFSHCFNLTKSKRCAVFEVSGSDSLLWSFSMLGKLKPSHQSLCDSWANFTFAGLIWSISLPPRIVA